MQRGSTASSSSGNSTGGKGSAGKDQGQSAALERFLQETKADTPFDGLSKDKTSAARKTKDPKNVKERL